MNQGKHRFIAAFLATPLLVYVVFVISPYVQAVYISMTRWSGFGSNRPFTGSANYARLIEDPQFWQALGHNALLLLVVPLVTIALGLFFASMLNVGGGRGRGVRGTGFYRVVYFLPYVLPVVIAAVLWQFIYNPQFGLLNASLDTVGLGALKQSWLGDPVVALWSVMAMMIWIGTGFYVVLFSAALQSIPREVYEAAELDGAGRFQTMLRVTLPMLRDTVQVAYVYLGIMALDGFALVQVLTPTGGPDNATQVVAKYMYDAAFERGEFGYAAAIGVALCVLTLLFAGVVFRAFRRERLEF